MYMTSNDSDTKMREVRPVNRTHHPTGKKELSKEAIVI
jgi:hypothetical protein